MKKNKIFPKPLLITQEEMSLLLGITRGQWAMYVSGQRGLALNGKLKFEQMAIAASESAKMGIDIEGQEKEAKKEMQKSLTKLQKDQALKELQLQRKLQKMEEQYQMALHTVQFVRQVEKTKTTQALLKVIENKAKKVLDKNTLAQQEVLKIKLEVLQYEKKLLEQHIKKLQ